MRNEWTGISVCVMSGLVHVRNEWTGISVCVYVCGEYRNLVLHVANIEMLCCLASMEKNIVLFVMSIELLCCPWRV